MLPGRRKRMMEALDHAYMVYETALKYKSNAVEMARIKGVLVGVANALVAAYPGMMTPDALIQEAALRYRTDKGNFLPKAEDFNNGSHR